MDRSPWRTLSSRTAYQNPWIRVREDIVVRPDGNEGLYGVVEIRPSVGVVALNEDEEMVLVGQWRYPHDHYSWEIPRGGSHDGETDMLAAAKRELAEEAGVEAKEWTHIGAVDCCNGVVNDVQTLYVARDLSIVDRNPDPEEEIAVMWKPLAEAVEMSMDGRIVEVSSVAAILMAARRLRKV